MSCITERILKELGEPELLERLDGLSGSDLTSLLLELFRRRAARTTPADVLRAYAANRFCAPAQTDPAACCLLEAELLTKAKESGMETVLLSPSAPFGSCSAFGCVDQNNVLTALRGTETMADPSNLLALHLAERIRREGSDETLRCAAAARVVRAQAFCREGYFAHFGLFCMVSGGCAGAAWDWEREELRQHLVFFREVLSRRCGGALSVVLQKRQGHGKNGRFLADMAALAHEVFPQAAVEAEENGEENRYYRDVSFKIYVERDGERFEVADGGFTDWLERMLGDRHRRCLISGMGLDRLGML